MAGNGNNVQISDASFKEIERILGRLPKEFSSARRRTVIKTALKPFINSAIQKAPQKSGDLKLSIGTKAFRNNKDWLFAGVILNKKIKIGGSVGSENLDAFYAKWIEYGFTHIAWAKKGETIRKGISSGRLIEISPQPFIRPAWDETKGLVLINAQKVIEKRIKAWERKNRRK